MRSILSFIFLLSTYYSADAQISKDAPPDFSVKIKIPSGRIGKIRQHGAGYGSDKADELVEFNGNRYIKICIFR